MRLLLTSTGLSNSAIQAAFLDLVKSFEIENLKVALITTAATTKEEKEKIKNNRKQLNDININDKNIVEIDIEDEKSVAEIHNCQVLFVCGGNTFYLLHTMRSCGFGTIIEDFLQKKGIYVGVSAGSIVVTPNISVAGIEPADPNEVNMTDFKGLSIIDFEVSPHVPEHVSYESMDHYSKEAKNKVIAIDHVCAVMVTDQEISFVGDGRRRIYNFKKNISLDLTFI